ncbi:MAG: 30S ribosomal protein S4, partial [Oscillospiraceae bacterium]|nr:30S ribosomal protein S4 [Oscillospiraceae bacterium]
DINSVREEILRLISKDNNRFMVGDVIALYEGSRSSEKFKAVVEHTAGRVVPLWLEPNKADFAAKVVRMPVPEDLDYETQTHLIVELYSK